MEKINHPYHYRGRGGLEAIDVIEGFDMGFHLGNVIKYILRAGNKAENNYIDDLKKARWYLNREIERIEKNVISES